jgi:hypothetical protein
LGTSRTRNSLLSFAGFLFSEFIMSADASTKTAIRKRLFFAAEQRGESGARHGFQWCAACRGRGEVCTKGGGANESYAFELCAACCGERILPAPAPPA